MVPAVSFLQNLKLPLPFFNSIWLNINAQTRPETRIGFGDTKPIVERVLSSAPLGMDGLWLAALHADDLDVASRASELLMKLPSTD